MLYYRVKPEYNGIQVLTRVKNNTAWHNKYYLIASELYTSAEFNRLKNESVLSGNGLYFERDFMKAFEKVNIKKSKIYWMFGARFQDTEKE